MKRGLLALLILVIEPNKPTKNPYQVAKIVKAEVEREGIPLERIILGGFSQGGSVAIYSSLTAASLRGLAGVFILSSWLPLSQVLSHDPSVGTFTFQLIYRNDFLWHAKVNVFLYFMAFNFL